MGLLTFIQIPCHHVLANEIALNLKYSCSATTEILHYDATRISRALKSLIFKPNSLMISISTWLITCVKGFDTCFIRNDHANRCGSWREGDCGNQQLGLNVSWQVEVRAEFDGKEVLHICITRLEAKWNEDTLEEISTQNGPFNFYSNSMSSCVSQWNCFKFEIPYRS